MLLWEGDSFKLKFLIEFWPTQANFLNLSNSDKHFYLFDVFIPSTALIFSIPLPHKLLKLYPLPELH